MSQLFSIGGLDVPELLARSLADAGITEPTAVQRAAIPLVLAGKDVVIQSPTGTGKTLAYLLPLLQRLRGDPTFRVVIVAPSPELAMQLLRVVEMLEDPVVSSCSLVGSGNVERQKTKLKQHPRIVVGTPGRTLEMIFAKKLKTAEIGALVLDETDEILSPENEKSLREIASRPEFTPQLIFASATIGEKAEKLAHDLMDPDFARASVGDEPLSGTVRHCFMTFEEERKVVWLAKLIQEHRIRRALVFVNKVQSVPHLHRFLNDHEVPAVSISSERSSGDRARSLAAITSGEARVLIATDTAARGLDVPGLDWVIHYEIARDQQTYLHRAGRTGRAGRSGTSVTLAAKHEMFLLEGYAKGLGFVLSRLR